MSVVRSGCVSTFFASCPNQCPWGGHGQRGSPHCLSPPPQPWSYSYPRSGNCCSWKLIFYLQKLSSTSYLDLGPALDDLEIPKISLKSWRLKVKVKPVQGKTLTLILRLLITRTEPSKLLPLLWSRTPMIPETYSRPVTTVLRQKDANLQGSSPSKVSQVTVSKDGQRTVLHRLQHRRGQTSKYPWYPC